MPQVPNNPPAPATEATGVFLADGTDCEALKKTHNIDTGSYSSHRGVSRTGIPPKQSHHFMQNAATKITGANGQQIISRGAALAILLPGGSAYPGSVHDTCNQRQNARMYNKKSGTAPLPAKNFGELKKLSRDDLAAGLKSDPSTAPDADKLADCIAAESENEVKEYRKKNPPPVNDSTPVDPPGGCLPAGTLVWVPGTPAQAVPVESLSETDLILTKDGPRQIVRIDRCRHDLVEILVGGSAIVVATFHRLMSAQNGPTCAGLIKVGDQLATASGNCTVQEVRAVGDRPGAIYRLALRSPNICFVGTTGVEAVVPGSELPIVRREEILPFERSEPLPCPS